MEHFVDGVLNVRGRVVRDAEFHPRRQLGLYSRKGRAHVTNHFQRIGRGQHPDAHECRGLSVEAHILVIVLGAEHDVGNLTQSYDYAVLFLDHKLAEFFRSP